MDKVAAWRMAVGSLASEDRPEIAAEALARRFDSPAFRFLGGAVSGDLLRVAFDELAKASRGNSRRLLTRSASLATPFNGLVFFSDAGNGD